MTPRIKTAYQLFILQWDDLWKSVLLIIKMQYNFVYPVNITNITAFSQHLVQVEKPLQNDASKIESRALLYILLANQSLRSAVF